MKKVLITGENSYIGKSVENWLMKEQDKYKVDTISVRDESWKDYDFSNYDVVFHVAGIAHVSSDPKKEDLYYQVNRDLTIEIADKAKKESVEQFIFMSSIIVYGNMKSNKGVIYRDTKPKPDSSYGASKLQAEEGIMNLQSDSFKVVIVRPPMIYGKGSKGNYPKLSKFAKITPIFPNIENKRSILHIDNLCELIKLIIDDEERGLFFPQNRKYVSTSEIISKISEVHGKRVIMIRLFNPMIRLLFGIRILNKVFGNLVYESSMSNYNKASYQIRSFKESIILTELESGEE